MLRPRAIVHRGHVEARGLLIDAALIGEAEARRRVLALWSPRASVFQLDEGYLLLLPEPLYVRADAAPGAALVELAKRRTSAPLDDDELELLPQADNAIVLVHGGRALIAELDDATRVDPAAWIDVADYEVLETKTLGELPPIAELVAKPVEIDLRKELEDVVPPPSPEAEQVLRDLMRPEGFAAFAAGAAEPRLWKRFVASLARFFARLLTPAQPVPQDRSPAQSTQLERALVDVAQPEKPTFLERLRRRLEELAAHLTRINVFARLVGQKHAEYIARMLEMFEKGDLEAALRHAIPLNEKFIFGAKPALTMPSPRSDLRISPSGPPRTSAINVDDNLFDDLRRTYRRAFERLAREGRIEEAAFVLAELLHSTEEAVAFLESHDRFELAAKLAESRGLSPGLVIRQWFLAGDIERAVQIARRTGAFGEAIARLSAKKEHREAADALRVLWAETLAAAGDYGTAVDTLWPVVAERHRAKPWVEAAIEAGGPTAARMLVRSLSLLPGSFAEVCEAVTALLANESFEGTPTRAALSRALISAAPDREIRVLARASVRAMVRDAAQWNAALEPAEMRSLTGLAGDGALRTDLPTRAAPSALARLNTLVHPRLFRFRADDGGALRVADAALLPSGRMLVALGELGVRYLTPDGRVIAAFDQPADRLVMSDHGDRAITLAARGEVVHLGRIDLANRRATPWCELALSTFAPSFDGSMWFVGERDRHGGKDTLVALDATSMKRAALWRLDNVFVERIARDASRLTAAIIADEVDLEFPQLELWTHELPSFALRRRAPFSAPKIDTLLADGTGTAWGAADRRLVVIGQQASSAFILSNTLPETLIDAAHSSEWVALAMSDRGGVVAVLIDPRSGLEHARIELGGARACSLRLGESVLVVSDDRGRVITVDHRYGRILRILRIS